MCLETNRGVYRSADRGSWWAPMSAKAPAPAPRRKQPARGGARRAGAQASMTAPAGSRGTSNTTAAMRPTAKVTSDVARRAQEALERAGYEIGVSDGQLGPRTVAAIRRFHTDRFLPLTGHLDDAPVAALALSASNHTSSLAR